MLFCHWEENIIKYTITAFNIWQTESDNRLLVTVTMYSHVVCFNLIQIVYNMSPSKTLSPLVRYLSVLFEKGFHLFVQCAVKLWWGMKCVSVRLLEDVGWDYWRMWGEIMMWGEIIGGCGVRLLHDVGWDYDVGEIIGGCGVRLLEYVGWDYWRMWGEIMMWGEIIGGFRGRLLHDVGWDYCMMWGEIMM